MSVFTNAHGQHVVGPLSNVNSVLRRQLANIVLRYRLSGREITKCPVAIAPGASFSRNQHPRNGLAGVDVQRY